MELYRQCYIGENVVNVCMRMHVWLLLLLLLLCTPISLSSCASYVDTLALHRTASRVSLMVSFIRTSTAQCHNDIWQLHAFRSLFPISSSYSRPLSYYYVRPSVRSFVLASALLPFILFFYLTLKSCL